MPYEAMDNKRPLVHFLRTFGCVAHVKTVKPNLKKLEDRNTHMVLFVYEQGNKVYRVYNPANKTIYVTRNVIFDEAAC